MVRGMRDYWGEEAELFLWMIDKVRDVYERFGFKPLITPALERWEVLGRKEGGGEAIMDEIYVFKDKGGRLIGLRFDLTVPMARFLSMNPTVKKPFKRYAIGPVWRYDRPQRGRYREFWQADVDTIGSKAPEADAEILACLQTALDELGFKDLFFRINDRRVLDQAMEKLGIPEEKRKEALICLDKLDKIGIEGVQKELKTRGIEWPDLKDWLSIQSLEDAEDKGLDTSDLAEIIDLAKEMGVKDLRYDFSLVRGLAYYTGFIFEVWSQNFPSSLGGGGRYDNLIKLYSGREMPATGGSLGLTRLFLLKWERGERIEKKLDVFVVAIKRSRYVVRVIQTLRNAGFSVDWDLLFRKPKEQIKLAAKWARIAAIVGEKEEMERSATLKDLRSGKQITVPLEELVSEVRKLLNQS